MWKFLKKKKKPENLEEVLIEVEKLKRRNKELSGEIERIKEKMPDFIAKVEIARYNPFSNVGGDQSFSIAMLNGNNDGFIITSLYSEEKSRSYAKIVEQGVPRHALSEEEKDVLRKAKEKNERE